MATAAAVREADALAPWSRADFRSELASLSASTSEAARHFAADVRTLARLIAMVPRCPSDDRGATPWTSFRREVAVARQLSDRGAAAEIRAATRLTGPLPRTMALLEAGGVTVQRARAFVTEVEPYDDDLATRLDADLADRVAKLPAWRMAQEVRRAALRHDPESAALRTATKNADRGVLLQPDADDQASVVLFGPAVPLTRWYAGLDERARGLRQGGDGRTLDALRFDLATSSFPCATHTPPHPVGPTPAFGSPDDLDATGRAPGPPGVRGPSSSKHDTAGVVSDVALAAAGSRPGFVESAGTDCRRGRPVQASIVVPVETALGLSNEPGWLDGYGWLSAPTTRTLLVDAELRRVCAQAETGQVVDVADREVRPPPGAKGVRGAVLDLVRGDIAPSDSAWRTEPEHDPSDALRRFVELRDRGCDGPTGSRVASSRSDLDHDQPHPAGPTAAWNLAARSRRTHQLKHYGWTPLRTPTTTLWVSPAGQVVDVPRHLPAPPGLDRDPGGATPALPDADVLAELDHRQLTAPDLGDLPPWLPVEELRQAGDWRLLTDVGRASS